jgi:uncharacterized protein YidB (DUF937 family)
LYRLVKTRFEIGREACVLRADPRPAIPHGKDQRLRRPTVRRDGSSLLSLSPAPAFGRNSEKRSSVIFVGYVQARQAQGPETGGITAWRNVLTQLEPKPGSNVPAPAIQRQERKMSRGMPSMTALLGLLALAGYQNRDKLAELLKGAGNSAQPGNQQGPLGGLLGGLSGALAGGGVGGLLNGGLGELLDRFKQNGQGDAAESWINKGPNKELPPPQLKQAIGPDVLAALEQQTGLSQEEILARLSRELPAAVDRYTPDGRIPH